MGGVDEVVVVFVGVDMSIKLKLMGVDVVSIGDVYGMMVGSCIY